MSYRPKISPETINRIAEEIYDQLHENIVNNIYLYSFGGKCELGVSLADSPDFSEPFSDKGVINENKVFSLYSLVENADIESAEEANTLIKCLESCLESAKKFKAENFSDER